MPSKRKTPTAKKAPTSSGVASCSGRGKSSPASKDIRDMRPLERIMHDVPPINTSFTHKEQLMTDWKFLNQFLTSYVKLQKQFAKLNNKNKRVVFDMTKYPGGLGENDFFNCPDPTKVVLNLDGLTETLSHIPSVLYKVLVKRPVSKANCKSAPKSSPTAKKNPSSGLQSMCVMGPALKRIMNLNKDMFVVMQDGRKKNVYDNQLELFKQGYCQKDSLNMMMMAISNAHPATCVTRQKSMKRLDEKMQDAFNGDIPAVNLYIKLPECKVKSRFREVRVSALDYPEGRPFLKLVLKYGYKDSVPANLAPLTADEGEGQYEPDACRSKREVDQLLRSLEKEDVWYFNPARSILKGVMSRLEYLQAIPYVTNKLVENLKLHFLSSSGDNSKLKYPMAGAVDERAWVTRPLNTVEVIRMSNPDFDTECYQLFFSKNLQTINMTTMADLRKRTDSEVGKLLQTMEDDVIKEGILKEGDIIQQVCDYHKALRHRKSTTGKK